MSDSDSDVDDVLNNLLANNDETPVAEVAPQVLKELDYNFLDNLDDPPEKVPEEKTSSLLHEDLDSSDDEGKKYFEEQKYSDSGRSIRDLLKHQASQRKDTSTEKFPRKPEKSDKSEKKKPETALTNWLSKPPDVYSDPVFGLRIVKPLISSAELKERMQDRKAITVSRVKSFLATQDQSQDWVIAGVLIHRSATKKSQNGNQYCIWQISDLSDKIPSVSLFLFSGAYKLFWKTSEGTVVGVLNPNVMESRSDKTEATLSVDNAQKLMIFGNSRDLGRCKSVKKSGDPCTNIVNKSTCEYCIYHVKQEYNKASRRTDLQTDPNSRRFGNAFGKQKNFGVPQGNGLNQLNMLAIPAKRNYKMEQRDSERLALLTQGNNPPGKSQESSVNKLGDVEALEKINKSRGWSSRSALCLSSISSLSTGSSKASPKSLTSKLNPTASGHSSPSMKPSVSSPGPTVPRLGCGVVGDTIDFSQPIPKTRISSAKMNAIKWAKEKGGIKPLGNVNKVGESREKIEASAKRKRDEEVAGEVQEAKKVCSTSEKFKELMEMTSAHEDLIEKADDNEKEKYFHKLEVKERMEEKMMTTFKVECKAVRCLICKYTAFSASDICKEKRHPLRVIDAVKSFFKCGDCGNRTVSLDKLPSHSCQKCSGSRWLRAAMMDERKTNISDTVLSIRGGEEKFVGSNVQNSSINLLVPGDENS